jgi:predicted dinucleotide-binding enzyme
VGKVLMLGGYGNFGKRIAEALARSRAAVIVAGRNNSKARALAAELSVRFPAASIEAAASTQTKIF